MTDPKYPDGAPEWYKPYMKCEFSDDGKNWSKPEMAIFLGKGRIMFPWILLGEDGDYNRFKYARPFKPWTPEIGEEVIAWDGDGLHCILGKFSGISLNGRYKLADVTWDHVARLHNEDGSCIDVSGGIEAIKTRTPWV